MSEPREFSVPVTVEFEDVDIYRIGHHTRLVAFLERARLRFFTSMGFEGIENPEVVPVIYDIEMRFVRPVLMLEELTVSVFVIDYDDFRLRLGYRIRRGGETVARARSSIAFMDPETRSLTAAPESHIAMLERFLAGD